MTTTIPDTGQLSAFFQARGFPLLILLIVTLIAFRAVRPIAHRLILGALERRRLDDGDPEVAALAVEESRKRVTTLEDLFATFLKALVVTVAVLVLLTMLDLLPVIAGLGILAAALTLAGQSIVLDFLMGILIVLEGPYSKGDWVQIGGVEGEVEDVGLRRTVLRDGTGTVHSVSNSSARTASNLTRIYARMLVDVTVAYGTDLERATRIVDEVGAAMAADEAWSGRLLETPSLLRVDALGELGMTLRIAGKVRAADRWVAPGELRKRLIAAFQANGIEIPVRGRVVLAREPGAAEPGAGPDPADGGSAGEV